MVRNKLNHVVVRSNSSLKKLSCRHQFSREEMLFFVKSSKEVILYCLYLAWNIKCLHSIVFNFFKQYFVKHDIQVMYDCSNAGIYMSVGLRSAIKI